jgi:ATP-dependent exoDNAse (exonuclease V) beta subunit
LAKTFSIYRSSAGSGKTRTLAKEYLKLALQYKADYFKHILAVTFTNKASQEMKNRILAYLDDFARGATNELARELKEELKLDDQTFQQHSQAVQAAILHQYAQFSISTIDAFFQKVIRSFTRESGLIGDYRLEVEHDAVLEEVIDNLIDELGSNKELTEWVVEFAKENLENERAWDVRYSLIEFAREIFREEFKSIEDEVSRVTGERTFFKQLKERLWSAKNFFLTRVSKPAQEALVIIQAQGWSAEDFSYGKNSGLLTFFMLYAWEKNLSRMSKAPSDRMRSYFTQAANWPNKKSPHKENIQRIAADRLVPVIREILDVYDEHYTMALSAEVALKNLYVFGLIADIARKLKEYKDENNVMLLADAPKFLNGIIQDSDTPFIYEKVGSFYRNYLIDEFQDTSGMQWKNFQPLIVNSLDQGYPGLVVGDVKQAIYRWRGGDLNLLQREIVPFIGEQRAEVRELDQNFRSAKCVVDFNNEVFRSAAALVSTETGTSISLEAYTDVAQKGSKAEEGFVQVSFIREPALEEKQISAGEESDGEAGSSRWSAIAMDQLPLTLEELQLNGAELKDIAILVRKNDEGQRIAAHLLQYKNSGKAKEGCHYDVVSNESLRIDGASSVNLLLGAMRYLLNAEDSVARAQLGYEFSRLREPQRDLPDVFSVTNQAIFENNLPAEFTDGKPALKKLPLIELTETLIGIFGLGRRQGELIYLQAFQDLVLEFYNREKNDLGAFLEWWEDNRHKKSVQIAGEVNAAQILTIHKSKGLQFKYVIIPFCSWNLDHDPWQSPNLWVNSEKSPFADAGYLPVRYAKLLEQTFFAADYQEEHTRSYLDNLNLLYVAFTRAEQGLIITAPHPEIRGAKASVAGLLFNSITGNETLRNTWDETEALWKSGEWKLSPSIKKETADYMSLRAYTASPWRDKLVIRQSGAAFFEEADTALRDRINYGIHMHAVLSRMKFADEIETTLEAIVFEGLITEQDRPSLRDELNELLDIPEVASWFNRSWKVYTEVPILVPGGNESRLDRLIVDDKKAVVIDFKTGEQKKNDNEQVVAYMDILRQMNFIDVRGYLLYLRQKEVVEVKEGGKQKATRKLKDKDQMSLGF